MFEKQKSHKEVEASARRIRYRVIEMISRLGIGYLQQGLGAADLFAALYCRELCLDENDSAWAERDRLILSTAHNTAVFYAAMAERRLIPEAFLETYTKDGSALEVNASERLGPLVEATCGSLGQGLSVGVGMALSLRRQGKPSRIYVILGDGELQEGQVWEAAMSASGLGLDNLCLIIDRNFMQVEGHTDKVMAMEPVADKWTAFGWRALTIDGNSVGDILAALDTARAMRGQPVCIIANTVPGKGVAEFEGRLSHMTALSPGQAETALAALATLW
jgi:transketolase